MGFKEVASLDADVTTAIGGKNKKTGKNNPTSLEGYYLGTRKVESKKSKGGQASIHFLQTPKGNIGVWGKTDLDRKIGGVTPGAMIRVSFTGMQATPNGDMYKYKVEVDQENTIDVEGLSATSQEESEYQDTDAPTAEEEAESEDVEDTDDEEDAVALAAASKAAKERAARVQAIVSKGKKA